MTHTHTHIIYLYIYIIIDSYPKLSAVSCSNITTLSDFVYCVSELKFLKILPCFKKNTYHDILQLQLILLSIIWGLIQLNSQSESIPKPNYFYLGTEAVSMPTASPGSFWLSSSVVLLCYKFRQDWHLMWSPSHNGNSPNVKSQVFYTK